MTFVTWCSFADDDGFRGLVLLPGKLDPSEASSECHRLGVNPGGQLLAVPVTESDFPDNKIWERAISSVGKLIASEEDIRRLFDACSIREMEAN